MISTLAEYQELIVVATVMMVAMFAIYAALRTYNRFGGGGDIWKERYAELERRMSKADSIFGAYPGLILIWDEKHKATDQGWGKPKVYGSPAALASIQRFAEPGRSKNLALRILDGLADLDAIGENENEMTLRKHLDVLRRNGNPFSISIVLPEGNVIEADGRAAGHQAVLWLEDASIRGEDERTAISRFETQKLLTQEDPVAFIDMLGRAPFPIWRMSSAGKLVWVNEAYISAVGADNMADVLSGQIQLDKLAAEEAQGVLNTQSRLENIRRVNIGRDMKSMLISLFPISGGAVGMAVDASETEDLRHALKRHVQSHDELLNNMDEAIVIFGADQRMSFHNTAFADLFSLEPGWFTTRPSHSEWLDLMRERQLLPLQSDYKAWKASELALYTDWPAEVPDEIWSLPEGKTLRLARMRDPRGGISLLLSDITNTVTLQSQFNTLINVQAATLDKLSEGIAVFGPDGRMKLSNKAFAKLWEIEESQLEQGIGFADIADKCLPLYHDKIFWNDLKARATDPNPDVRLHVDGEIKRSDDKILTWLSRPLPDGATLMAWQDVTSARKAEAALIERAEALEAADRLKSEFVGHVSYQLRTPLTTISGYADFLQNNLAGELSDKQSEYVFAIQTASEDLKKTIDDILDIAAIEANVLDLELGDVDIFELLDQALDYVATKAEDTRKNLTLECPEDVGVIRADGRRLKQVIYNLLSNALRFTKPGGNIILGAKPSHNGGVQIWVRDDGVGIPSDRQPQVFESFKSSRGGAGLGLALVQRFVERHGGWVELESEEGQGTYVTFYMPKEAAIDAAHPEFEFKVAE
ncbi:MAG: tyrosine protein kinase [Hellea sp.]|nr:tyrosine protein kinase [Hellea sp.]